MVDVMRNRMLEAFNIAPREREQNDSLVSTNHLKRYASEQRTRNTLGREADVKVRECHLYEIKENCPPLAPSKVRPLQGLTCMSCSPVSRESLINKTTRYLGLKNILYEYPAISNSTVLNKTFTHLSQIYNAKAFEYKQVAGSVQKNDRLKDAIEKSAIQQFQDADSTEDEYYNLLWKNNEKRARKLLKDMRSTMSDFLLKLTAWVLYKLLPCFLSAVVVHTGQVEMLKKASKSGLPLIFLPLHRSHLDYVMISFILVNNSIRCPLIAAGDNLRIPIFGSLLRGLGAFFIKRRIDPVMGQKDYVYKALLRSYINTGLNSGHNLEFFLEGGRTRTGKPSMPKYGIFSIVLDAFMNDAIEDALLVPVSINYEKLVDGNFIREQLGQPKEMETFGSAIKAIWQVLNSDYGMVRIDFNQPVSIRELVKTFNTGKLQNKVQRQLSKNKKLQSNPSTSSLYGSDVVCEDYKDLVENISKHVIYDSAASTSVMSTNALAFLLLHRFRLGGTLEQLSNALDELRADLEKQEKDVGFTGDSLDVVNYSIEKFGSGLVRKEKNNNEDIIKPLLTLPTALELNYYSNTLTNFYALDAIIALGLYSLNISSGLVPEHAVIERCLELGNIFQFEFIFCKPCQDLECAVRNCMDNMSIYKEVFITDKVSEDIRRSRRLVEELFEEEEEYVPVKYCNINNTETVKEYLDFLKGLLMPLIESYSVTAFCLDKLVGRELLENELIKEVLDEMYLQLESGSINYEESISSDSIKNALKLFQRWEILECHSEGKLRVYYLKLDYDNDHSIRTLCTRIDKFRYDYREQQD